MSKRQGGEKRGNSRDRRIRKLWMLAAYGDGHMCLCVHCSEPLTYESVEADRIVPGGSYRRENVQPACRQCNSGRSDDANYVGSQPSGVKPNMRAHIDVALIYRGSIV